MAKNTEQTNNRAKRNGITFSTLLIIVISMVIVLILAMLKIYLSNQIYYESRRVNYIEGEVAALREENVMLKNQVQNLKFKNWIASTIFVEDQDFAEDQAKSDAE
jgi:cell division protein FtsL